LSIDGPGDLLKVFSELSLSKENLRFKGEQPLEQINDYFTSLLLVNNYTVSELEKQIFCLVFRASRKFKPKLFTLDNFNPTIDNRLKPVLDKMISRGNYAIEPAQLLNFAHYADVNKGDEKEIILKKSKWTKKHKIILKYKINDEVNYVFFYHEMPRDAILTMQNNWNNVSLTPDSVSTSKIRPVLFNESNRPRFSPVFTMLGIKHKSMNEIFLNSIRHNQVVNGILSHINKATRYNGWLPKQCSDAASGKNQFTVEFENTIFSNFPRIKSRWMTLDSELKQAIYRCFLELKHNDYELFLQYGENGQPFIHGDEWGDNFLMSDGKEVMLIDLEDTLSLNLLTKELTNSGRLSHLYRRIYLNTDDEVVYHSRYLNNDEIDPASLIDDDLILPIFDVSRSMGRLIAALVQIYTQQNGDYLKEYNDEKITEFFENYVAMIFEQIQDSIISKNRGWFLLSIIDWSLYWEQRKPLSLLEGLEDKDKFHYRTKFTSALSKKINERLDSYYFISDELEKFRVILHQSPIDLINQNDHFRGIIRLIEVERFKQFSTKNYSRITGFWCKDANLDSSFLKAMTMIYCDTDNDASISHINAKPPSQRFFKPKLNEDIEELIRYNKEVFNHQILNSKVIPRKPNYQTLLLR
jgi:hypothetical protein